MKSVLALVVFTLLSTTAFAQENDGIKAGLGIFKYDTSTEGSVVGTGETSNMVMDIKLGKLSKTFYWGLLYSTRTAKNGSESTEDKRTAYGPTIGYHAKGGWFIDFTYFFSAERALGETKLTGGSGFSLDLGHNRMVGKNLYVGIQGTYKSISYKKTNGNPDENKEKSEMYPMFNIGFMF